MGVSDYNVKIIAEFRANKGIVGGPFAGANLLLLHTTGAKSKQARVNPLAYFEFGSEVYIVASYAGHDNNPPWYYNLVATPEVKMEIGDEMLDATAEVVSEPERTQLYEQIAAKSQAFAEYQQKTSRIIPLVRLRQTT